MLHAEQSRTRVAVDGAVEDHAEDDDAEYYRSEVGQEPEKGMKF